jgi:hypothetical protein
MGGSSSWINESCPISIPGTWEKSKKEANVDRRELAEHLKTVQAPADSYAIGEIHDEALCMVEENGGWSIFYSEREWRAEEQRFSDENSACKAFLQRLKHMLGMR